MKKLWVEKHRPSNIEGVIFANEKTKNIFRSYVEEQEINFYQAEFLLTEAYFEYLTTHTNSFVAALGYYYTSLNNLKVAYNGRKHDVSYDKQLIGENELTHALRKSRTRDFGASTLVDNLESLLQIF